MKTNKKLKKKERKNNKRAKGKRASLLHSNWTLLTPAINCRAGTTVGGSQASGLGHLLQYMRKYNAKSPKQGRKGFNSIVKTINFSYLPIIYLCTHLSSASVSTFFQRLSLLFCKERRRRGGEVEQCWPAELYKNSLKQIIRDTI